MYKQVGKGIQWKDKPVRTGPNANSQAFKDAMDDLHGEADAAGCTGAVGHFKYHHRKMALEDQAKVKSKAKAKKYEEMTGSEKYRADHP